MGGYIRLLSSVLIDIFQDRILNIHPSLLPSFPGLHGSGTPSSTGSPSRVHRHLVDIELDHGPIVIQRAVAVEGCADADALADRILPEEHKAYPDALRRLLDEPW